MPDRYICQPYSPNEERCWIENPRYSLHILASINWAWIGFYTYRNNGEVSRLKFTSVSTKCLTPDAIFYCDLLCVLLFLLLINTHIVICYENAGKHEKETHQTNTNTNISFVK